MSERKKEEARRRAKSVSDNARWARKTGTTRQRTPGVKIIGAPIFAGPDDSKKTAGESDAEVADVMIARILGPDEKWGLERKFFFKSRQSLHAHRFSDGTVIEVGLQSYNFRKTD